MTEGGGAVRAGTPPFVPALTGVRAFAALWVVLLHLTEVTAVLVPGRAAAAFAFVGSPGFLGVHLFFVLSGFIISYNYEGRFADRFVVARYLGFLRARLARIYPVHVVLLLMLVVVVRGLGVDPGGGIDPARWSTTQLVESLVLVQAWIGHTAAWNSVSWSISAEWLAYLLFPVMVTASRQLARLGRTSVWLVVVAIMWVPAIPGKPDLPPLTIGVEFLAGCVMYQLYRQGRGRGGLTARPGWALLALVLSSAVLHRLGVAPLWAVPLVPALILGLAYGQGRLTRWFASPVMVYAGKISFALYMTHYLWLWVMHYLFPLTVAGPQTRALVEYGLSARVVWVFVHALPMPLVAAATYHLIEEPARHWLMKGARRPA